jgi:hypothetical protein
MRVAGQRSWRCTTGSSEELHFALYVRDALGLPIHLSEPWHVPRVLGGATDRSALCQGYGQPALASAWQLWFSALIATPSYELPADYLADSLIAELFGEIRPDFMRWFAPRVIAAAGETGSLDQWRLFRDAVVAAASQRKVPVETLEADTQLLFVEGVWWHQPRRGWLLYSPALTADHAQFSERLQAAFASSV